MKRVAIEIEGQTREVLAAFSEGTLWMHLDGEIITIEAPRRQRRGGKASAGAQPGVVVSPMPGKIIKILDQVGSDVKTGDVLLVMEAMKMEYTLKAQVDGRVAEVSCAAGDQVALGQVLVRLETNEEVGAKA